MNKFEITDKVGEFAIFAKKINTIKESLLALP